MQATDTKTKLLDCAQELIQRVGINAMSYNDLSEVVGIRKASIHYYFPKKEDLINELLCNCKEAYGSQYQKIADADEPASSKLRRIAEIYENGVRQNRICIVGILSAEYESLGPETHENLKKAIDNTVKIYEKIFAQGLELGEFQLKGNSYNAAYAFFNFLLGGQIISRCSKDPESFAKTTDVYIKNLIKK